MNGFQELSAPLDVEFGITRKCQLRCSYCSAMPLEGGTSATERSLAIIEELGSLNVFSLLISGGEPTLHPAFFEIITLASKLIPSVLINTNGIKLSKIKYVEKIKELAPNILVSISLDSADPNISDIERGNGGQLAIMAIENCISAKLNVCVSSVLTESSIDSAIDLIEKFAPQVRKFRFFPRVPRNENDLFLNSIVYQKKVEKFYKKLKTFSTAHPELDLLTPTSFINIDSTNDTKCICTSTKLYIDETLNVYPCYYSANSFNKIGSCVINSIQNLWNSEKALELRKLSQNKRLCGVRLSEQKIPARYDTCN